MRTARQGLFDDLMLRSIGLERLSRGLLREMLKVLGETEREIEREILRRLSTVAARGYNASDATLRRLNERLAAVRSAMRDAYSAAGRKMRTDLRELAAWEVKAQADALIRVEAQVLGTGIRVVTTGEAFSASFLREIVELRPFAEGGLLSEWFEALGRTQGDAVVRAVRQGMLLGEGIDKIVRRAIGTRAASSGALARGYVHTETIVRSAVMHVANTVAEEFYAANEGLIAALVWLSVMDERTSPGCTDRDGHRYHAKTHKALDGGPPWDAGPGKRHPRCRATSYAEVVFDGVTLSPSQRASMGGPIDGSITRKQWLTTAPAWVQDKAIGRRRADLLRAGKLSIDDVFNDLGELRSVADLERWYGQRSA